MLQDSKALKHRVRRGERNGQALQHADGSVSRTDPRARPVRNKPKPRESFAKDSFSGHRDVLLALRRRLRGSVSQIADTALTGYGVEGTSASPDTADRASETIEQDIALDLLGSAAGALDQVEEALQRIERGTYGRCKRCGVAIPAPRLEAIPYTPYCVECASRREQKRVA